MLQKTVITKEGEYSFAMHTYRALLTNFFPADYDYEAKIQNLRHRIYITWHGKDRWWSQKNFCYRAFSCIMDLFICTPFYLSTCCNYFLFSKGIGESFVEIVVVVGFKEGNAVTITIHIVWRWFVAKVNIYDP